MTAKCGSSASSCEEYLVFDVVDDQVLEGRGNIKRAVDGTQDARKI